MDSDEYEVIKKEIINCHLSLKALIQEIYQCNGPIEKLNELNSDGRAKLHSLKGCIDELHVLGKEVKNDDLLFEAKNLREQYYNTFSAFRKANVECMMAIEKLNKEELFQFNDEESFLRNRQKKDKANLVKMSSGITNQLLAISRHLADTTQLSSDTLSTLANSSTNVMGTQDELQTTNSVISQSGKLLEKYARRQFTDKLIILLAFLFFIACVVYIFQKRFFKF